jgi:hypothetical protein
MGMSDLLALIEALEADIADLRDNDSGPMFSAP